MDQKQIISIIEHREMEIDQVGEQLAVQLKQIQRKQYLWFHMYELLGLYGPVKIREEIERRYDAIPKDRRPFSNEAAVYHRFLLDLDGLEEEKEE